MNKQALLLWVGIQITVLCAACGVSSGAFHEAIADVAPRVRNDCGPYSHAPRTMRVYRVRFVDSTGDPIAGVIADSAPEKCSDLDGMLDLPIVESGGTWTFTHPLCHTLIVNDIPQKGAVELRRKDLEFDTIDQTGIKLGLAGRVEVLDMENRYLGGGKIPGHTIRQSEVAREIRFYGKNLVGTAIVAPFSKHVKVCVGPPVSVRFFHGEGADVEAKEQATKVTLHHFAEASDQTFPFVGGESLVAGLIPKAQYLYSLDGGHIGRRVLLAPRLEDALDIPVFPDGEISIPLSEDSVGSEIRSVHVSYEFDSGDAPFEIRGGSLVLPSSAIDRRLSKHARVELRGEGGELLAEPYALINVLRGIQERLDLRALTVNSNATSRIEKDAGLRQIAIELHSSRISYFSLQSSSSTEHPPIYLSTNRSHQVELPRALRYELLVGGLSGLLKLGDGVESVSIDLRGLAPMEQPFVELGSGRPLVFRDVEAAWTYRENPDGSPNSWSLSLGGFYQTNRNGQIEEELGESGIRAQLTRSWQPVIPHWGIGGSSLGGGGTLPPSILAQYKGIPIRDDVLGIEKQNGKTIHFYGKRVAAIMPESVLLTQAAGKLEGIVDSDKLRKLGKLSGLRPVACPGGWSAVGVAELPYLYVVVGDRTLQFIGVARQTPFGFVLDIDYSKLPKKESK